VDGKLGKAFNFSGGTASYAIMPNSVLDGMPQFTVAMWAKTAYGADGAFSVASSRIDNEFLILTSSYIHIKEVQKSSGISFNDDNWHYIVVSVDSTSGVAKTYLDGVLKKSIPISKTPIVAEGIVLGQDQDRVLGGFTSAQSYKGLLDEIAIFNRVLSDSEVAGYYNNGLGKADVCGAIPSPTIPTPTTPTTPTTNVPTCTENWNCTAWSTCVSNLQTKTCIDLNSCGTIVNRPVLSLACVPSNTPIEENNTNENTDATATCTDTDNGINYYQQGYIDQTFSPSGRHYDSCIDASVVKEWSCIPNGTFRYDDYTCPNGCSNGACSEGGDFQVIRIYNYSSPDYSRDRVTIKEVSTGLLYDTVFTSEGIGVFSFNGIQYVLSFTGSGENGVLYIDNLVLKEDDLFSLFGGGNSCDSLIQKLKNPKDYVYNEAEFKLSFNNTYSTQMWFDGEEHKGIEYYASWYTYDDSYKNIAYDVIVFDEEDIDLTEWLNQNLDYQLCVITSSSNNEKEDYYYICNWDALRNKQSTDYQYSSRQVYWIDKNIAVQVYVSSGKYLSNEEVIQLSQKRMLQLMEDIRDNSAKSVSWDNFDIDWILQGQIIDNFEDCPSEVELEVNPENNNTCWPSWSCKIEPAICPEHGYQTKTCVDYSCGQKTVESQIFCSPGICSGCMVPRWFGSVGDNTCIPYGFRFAQQTGWEEKYVERTESDTLTEGEQDYISLKVLSDTEAILTLKDQKGNLYNYTLKEGESVTINIPGWESGIDKIVFDTKDIFYSSQEGVSSYIDFSATVYGWDRISNSINAYCDLDGQVKQQKMKQSDGGWTTCQNNYECYSNLCSGGQCVEINDMIAQVKGFKATGVKILCKLASVFGIEEYDSCLVNYLGDDYTSSSSSSSSGGSGSSGGSSSSSG